MTVESAFAFIGALVIWTLIPGPAIFMVIGRSLGFGFASTLSLVAGILLGDVVYILFALFGLSAIGHLLGDFFFLVRILGAVYLIYLGVSLWRAKVDPLQTTQGVASPDLLKSFIAGFGITLGNPKAVLFHLGFLPVFFDLSAIGVVDAILIIAIFLGVLASALLGYAFLASKARALFTDARKRRLLNRGAGTLLVGTGVAVLVKR